MVLPSAELSCSGRVILSARSSLLFVWSVRVASFSSDLGIVCKPLHRAWEAKVNLHLADRRTKLSPIINRVPAETPFAFTLFCHLDGPFDEALAPICARFCLK